MSRKLYPHPTVYRLLKTLLTLKTLFEDSINTILIMDNILIQEKIFSLSKTIYLVA